jgi:nitrogen fixation NifU-like protein
VTEFDQLYREVILDHYKNPRGHGLLEDADAQAEGLNPLCGDEVTVSLKFAADGETIEDVGFEGRGCAISQAATSMLTEIVRGRKASEVAELPKVALHRAKGTPLPDEWQGLDFA